MHPLLYLLPLGLIFDVGGYLPPYLRLFLIYGLVGLPLCLHPSKRAALGGLGLLAVMGAEATMALPPVADVLLLLIAHQWVWALVSPIPPTLTAGLLFYAFLHLFLFLSPLGYSALEAFASLGSRISGWVTGSAYHLGYTYQSLGGLLLFLCLSVFNWDRSRISKARTASFLLVAVLLNALLSALLIHSVDFGADLAWKLKYRDVFGYAELLKHVRGLGVLAFPHLVFLAYVTTYLLLHYEARKKGEEDHSGRPDAGPLKLAIPRTPWQVGTLVLAVLLILLCTPPAARRGSARARLVLVERGVVSYTRPDYTRFGSAAGGMYGMLPDYAQLFGCEAVVVRDVPDVIDADQILVLVNMDEPLRPDVHRRIWDFVAAGGRLWVLGDHTFIKNGRNHINDLLAPCHISLKHDSAQFFPQGWFSSYRFAQGTAFAGLQDPAENRPAILVGASLDLRPPAQPFIVGRFGYSDWGVTAADDKRGYIGDFKYQPEERLGDLVLVAGERYGRGKVLVFGDTTSFFNNNLSRSYELLRAVLSWFGEPWPWSVSGSWPVRIAAGLVLLALGALLWVRRSSAIAFAVLAATFLVSLIIHRPTGLIPFDTGFARRRLAVIDFSHQPYASKHSGMGSGLHGLSINLMRYGILPATINRWDREILDAAAMVVLNAPRRPFTATERRSLMEFMDRGGIVLLGCGYPHYESSRPLLDPLQLRIRSLPLGRFFDRTAFGQPLSFTSAWPIGVDRPDASVLCVYNDWPLIVAVPVGKGRLVLIADSEFLQNRNLEGTENYDPANIRFIKSLLDYVTGARGGE